MAGSTAIGSGHARTSPTDRQVVLAYGHHRMPASAHHGRAGGRRDACAASRMCGVRAGWMPPCQRLSFFNGRQASSSHVQPFNLKKYLRMVAGGEFSHEGKLLWP